MGQYIIIKYIFVSMNVFLQKNSLPKEFDTKMYLRGSIKNIIKKYFNKEVLMQYTVSKKKKGRGLFCETTMYKCMLGKFFISIKQ